MQNIEQAVSVGTKDKQTVTAAGEPVNRPIDGVIIKHIAPIEDERGEICEIYRPSWGLIEAPLVYVYQSIIRPGKVKGWVVHEKQEDRLFLSSGTLRFGLFDNRPNSPTYRALNVFTFSDRNRALIIIPRGVFHGIQNVGLTDAMFVNMPTAPYHHEDPDKYRLPLKNSLIPFAFEDEPGW